MDLSFGAFSFFQMAVLAVAALLIGINKTGMPGLGLIPVVMLAMVFPTGLSTGLQLVMLCTADLAAVAWYRRSANWKIILRLIPAALAGIAAGHCVVRSLDDVMMKLAIGSVVLVLGIISICREIWWQDSEKIPSHWCFAVLTGVLAGFSTQVANAAGPIMALYLVSMRLPKQEYMGTAAWYFLILNWTKLPIFAWEGRITALTLKADLMMLPFLILGAVLGILMFNRMPKKLFNRIVILLSTAAALWMIGNAIAKLCTGR